MWRDATPRQLTASTRAPEDADDSHRRGTRANRSSYSRDEHGAGLAQRGLLSHDDGASAPPCAREPRAAHAWQGDRAFHHPVELGPRALVEIAQRFVRADEQLARDAATGAQRRDGIAHATRLARDVQRAAVERVGEAGLEHLLRLRRRERRKRRPPLAQQPQRFVALRAAFVVVRRAQRSRDRRVEDQERVAEGSELVVRGITLEMQRFTRCGTARSHTGP